jgi:hypothetical protein
VGCRRVVGVEGRGSTAPPNFGTVNFYSMDLVIVWIANIPQRSMWKSFVPQEVLLGGGVVEPLKLSPPGRPLGH